MWVKTAVTGGMLFDKRDGATDGFLFLVSADSLHTRINSSTSTGAIDFTDDEWHLVLATYDAINVRPYIDAVADTVDPVAGATIDITGDLHIGVNFTAGGEWFTGTIGEMFIWNRDFTSSEVTRLFQTTQWRYQ